MFLSSLSVRNYRSIVDATLEGLGHVNVLIGRNNAGKSSVFSALRLLRDLQTNQIPNWVAIAPFGNMADTLGMSLVFTLGSQEREELANRLLVAGYDGSRRQALLDGTFARKLRLDLVLMQPWGWLGINQTDLLVEGDAWAMVQTRSASGDPNHGPGNAQVIPLGAIARRWPHTQFNAALFDVARSDAAIDVPMQPLFALPIPDEVTQLLYQKVATYFSQAFFFTPFRHSTEQMPVGEASTLASDGANLAQVLLTIKNNEWRIFEEIQAFVEAALPGIGLLQTRITGGITEIYFESRSTHYRSPLRDMGGGIEQLLMVATVLSATGDESTIFLEEPETHLHAGAQRFLVEKLYAGSMNERSVSQNRQVFMTTHSPTLINLPGPRTIHRVTHMNNRTVVSSVKEPDDLEDLLEDIGARNSDVLLSDAVLFVEGQADSDTLRAWGERLKLSLTKHNITVLPMGGGDDAARKAPLRQEVLAGISQRATVPHLFLLDRDERSEAEVDQLRRRLGTHIHILERREMENYLLIPRALLAALRAKHEDDPAKRARLAAATEEEVQELIMQIANSLFDTVLLKRIRAEIGGLRGGFLPRDQVSTLIASVRDPNFVSILRDRIQQQVEQRLADVDIEAVVRKQRELLNEGWADVRRRPEIAPGEEVVSAVFKHFDSKFRKTRDGVLIAQHMNVDDIALEMQTILKRAVTLADRQVGV